MPLSTFILAAALQAAIPAPAVQPPVPRWRQTLVEPGDYPAQARRRGRQGIVRVALIVGPDGRVADCRVTTSSGTPVLDQTTCRIMRERARFRPARDAAGNPTVGSYRDSVNWYLPRY